MFSRFQRQLPKMSMGIVMCCNDDKRYLLVREEILCRSVVFYSWEINSTVRALLRGGGVCRGLSSLKYSHDFVVRDSLEEREMEAFRGVAVAHDSDFDGGHCISSLVIVDSQEMRVKR